MKPHARSKQFPPLSKLSKNFLSRCTGRSDVCRRVSRCFGGTKGRAVSYTCSLKSKRGFITSIDSAEEAVHEGKLVVQGEILPSIRRWWTAPL